jgi:hypothetical protein
MPLLDGRASTTTSLAPARRQREAALRRAHPASAPSTARSRPISTRSRARCDSSACLPRRPARRARRAIRPRPGLGQRAGEREQHRPRRERDRGVARVAHGIAARIDDQRRRALQRLDLLEQQRALLAIGNQPRRRRVQQPAERCRPPPSAPGMRARRAACGPASAARAAFVWRRRMAMPATTSSCAAARRAGAARDRARRAPLRPRRGGRSGAGAAPRDARHARRSAGRHALRASPERRRAPSPASRGRARRARSRPRRRCSAPAPPLLSDRRRACPPQQQLGPFEIAELRHGDAAQRQRRRVVAQRDPVQRAERVARGERARCRGDQRVHRNPATLVTPTPAPPRSSLDRYRQPARRIGRLHQPMLHAKGEHRNDHRPATVFRARNRRPPPPPLLRCSGRCRGRPSGNAHARVARARPCRCRPGSSASRRRARSITAH